MAAAKISSKGQVTIPVEVRRWLGVKPGEQVDFVRRNGDIVVRPARSKKDDPFAKYVGALGGFPGGVKEINAWIRGLRDEGEA